MAFTLRSAMPLNPGPSPHREKGGSFDFGGDRRTFFPTGRREHSVLAVFDFGVVERSEAFASRSLARRIAIAERRGAGHDFWDTRLQDVLASTDNASSKPKNSAQRLQASAPFSPSLGDGEKGRG